MESIRKSKPQMPYVHKSILIYLHPKSPMVRVHFSYEDIQYFDRLEEIARKEGMRTNKLVESILKEALKVDRFDLGIAIKAKAREEGRSVSNYAQNILINYLEKTK